MSDAAEQELCLCGCGLPGPKTFNTQTGLRGKYRSGHWRRSHKPEFVFPVSDVESRQIRKELSAALEWKEKRYLPGSTAWSDPVIEKCGPDSGRIKAAVRLAVRVLRNSPTLRRIAQK